MLTKHANPTEAKRWNEQCRCKLLQSIHTKKWKELALTLNQEAKQAFTINILILVNKLLENQQNNCLSV